MDMHVCFSVIISTSMLVAFVVPVGREDVCIHSAIRTRMFARVFFNVSNVHALIVRLYDFVEAWNLMLRPALDELGWGGT